MFAGNERYLFSNSRRKMDPPLFFSSPQEFNAWLTEHHATRDELIVGFYKKATGKPSLTWPESVDEALCFGWIDGIRRRLDDESYTIRFTPRRPNSNWSARNIERVKVLTRQKRMQPAGKREFSKRKPAGGYSYELADQKLDDQLERRFQENKKAWKYFLSLSPSVRKASVNWIASAKRESTRLRRLEQLIGCSSRAEILPQFLQGKPKTTDRR
jgi:uncharacterized protein YdeI (YjbR/CyaY-like superfamily)